MSTYTPGNPVVLHAGTPLTVEHIARAGRVVFRSCLTLLVAAIWAGFLFMLGVIVPKFEAIFTDFGTSLPPLTIGLIRFSKWFLGNQPSQSVPGWPLVILAMVAVVAGLWVWSRDRRGLLALCVALLVSVILMGAFVTALFTPLSEMSEALQAG